MVMACSACAVEAVVDNVPFLPLWAAIFLVWASALYPRYTAAPLIVSAMLGVGLAVFPPTVYVIAAFLLAWSLWLMVRASVGSRADDADSLRRRRVDVLSLNALAVAMLMSYWVWNLPWMEVQRLGNGRMAPRARERLISQRQAGKDVMPRLLDGLRGRGRYWLQSSDTYRQTQILALLTDWREPGAIPAVGALLQDGDLTVVQPAIQYLEAVGGEAAVDALLDYAQGRPERYQDEVAAALKRMTGKDFGVDWRRWRQWRAGGGQR